jgi:hypothetical protein
MANLIIRHNIPAHSAIENAFINPPTSNNLLFLVINKSKSG